MNDTSVVGRTALITTSTGQDSFYLARALKTCGYYVYGLSGGSATPHSLFDELLPYSFTDTNAVIHFLSNKGIDEVYNLASKSSVAKSWENPNLYFEVNYLALKRLLRGLIKTAAKDSIRILQVGSTDMIGNSVISQPFDYGSAWSPYGKSKLLAHFEAMKARDEGLYCVPAVVTNHDSPIRPRSFAIPNLAHQICEVIMGRSNMVEMSNWRTTRDWACAEDCVEAMILSLRQPEPMDVLIGTGVSLSLEKLASFTKEHFKIDFLSFNTSQKMRAQDLERIYLDVGKTEAQLGWTARRKGPETMFYLIEYLLRKKNAV